ncbi:IS21-like element helper ATPase IstB [Pseudomonadota bacterium]
MQQLQEQLTRLSLSGIKTALIAQQKQPAHYQELSFEERLSLLLNEEQNQRENKKIIRLTRQAKFRLRAELDSIDYRAERQLDKAQVRTIAQAQWLELHQNLLITGATGCGKTYIACALGHHYCQQGHSVYYFRLKELLEKLYLAQADGSYRKLVNKLASCQLLILDDWGLEPLNARQRSDLLELIDARYDTKSTIISSQLPVANWYQMIGDSTHADAILDRVIHSSIKLELKGESMRKRTSELTDGDRSD